MGIDAMIVPILASAIDQPLDYAHVLLAEMLELRETGRYRFGFRAPGARNIPGTHLGGTRAPRVDCRAIAQRHGKHARRDPIQSRDTRQKTLDNRLDRRHTHASQGGFRDDKAQLQNSNALQGRKSWFFVHTTPRNAPKKSPLNAGPGWLS